MGMFGVTPKKTGSTGPGVSDVIERFANLASFPTTGIEDLLYHAVDTDIMYFWNGTEYVALNSDNFCVGGASANYIFLPAECVGGQGA